VSPLGFVVMVRFAPVPVLSSEKIRWAMIVASVSRMLFWEDFRATGSMPTMAMTAKETIPRAITTSMREKAWGYVGGEGEWRGVEWLLACVIL
jgi:hypothetical protein